MDATAYIPDFSEARAAVVREAMSWIGTPYHHAAGVKGAGVDCAFFLIRVFQACGLAPYDLDPRPYPRDWHLHQDGERYLGWIERYCHQVIEARPGDIALFKFGRCVSHGAIVTAWPMVIHSWAGEGVRLMEADRGPLEHRLSGFWSVF